MRAPAFWWRGEPGALALLLSPLGWAYGAVTASRMARSGVRIGTPVVCVGNFVAGGAGKTPTAMAVAKTLRRMGERPFFLTRGYGAAQPVRTPLRVDLARHGAGEVGDEPLLLARVAPTIVCADRIAGAQAAARAGASVIVMDDGLQNPGLHKDLAIAVVDGGAGVGNSLCIPAGPLRAPLRAQFDHVDAVIVIGRNVAGDLVARRAEAVGLPTLHAALVNDPEQANELRGARAVAFAGIGRPEKFFETLRGVGVELAGVHAFPDHYVFREGDLDRLRGEANERQALLVTTEKDFVRLGQPRGVRALRVELTPARWDDFEDLLRQGLKRARG